MWPGMPEPVARGTLLAFDFGEKRIGVAVGELEARLSRPLTTLAAVTNDVRWAGIARLLDEWRPVRLVVGLPLTPDGEAHAMTERCRRFARQLEGRYRLPVTLQDERFSSAEAEADLRQAGFGWREAKQHTDAQAACIILQDYLDAFARS